MPNHFGQHADVSVIFLQSIISLFLTVLLSGLLSPFSMASFTFVSFPGMPPPTILPV